MTTNFPIQNPRIIIAGCGALGSQIAMHIADNRRVLHLIDFDVVEYASNIATRTSAFWAIHDGVPKTRALANMLKRHRLCSAIEHNTRLTAENASTLLRDADLIVDGFDNAAARLLTNGRGIPVVHVAVSELRTGLIAWNAQYTPPVETDNANPVCTNQLGANILRLTSASAANIVEWYLTTGQMRSAMTTELKGIE